MVSLSLLKNKDWDFNKVDTKRMTHGIHKYPARMVPQMTTELIETFSKKGDVLLDPFMGSGTVITEAYVLGRKAIGNDLNPLARLISNVRTTTIKPERLQEIRKFLVNNFKRYDGRKKIKIDENLLEANINYWFKPSIIKKTNSHQNYH